MKTKIRVKAKPAAKAKLPAKAKTKARPHAKPRPEGMQPLSPHLVCSGAANAIAFYKKAFGAKEMMSLPGKDGRTHSDTAGRSPRTSAT